MPFAVLQTRFSKLTGEQLEPMLELYRELMYTVGTTKKGRDYSGILAENLTRERADKLSASLRAVGVETEVRDQSQLVPNPRAFPLRNADCIAAGFQVQDMYGRARVHPWETVLLLCAGEVAFERTETRETTTGPSAGERLAGAGIMLATGVPTSAVFRRQKTEKTSVVKKEDEWVLDVFTLSDAPHYRIIASQFNYDYLGTRRREQSWENFQLLLSDLAKFAVNAVRDDGFAALLAGQTSHLAEHASARAFDEANRWYLQFIKRGA